GRARHRPANGWGAGVALELTPGCRGGPDRQGAGSAAGAGARALEPADRERALAGRANGEVSPLEHLSQARRPEPHRGGAASSPPRVRLEPDLPRGLAE